MRNTLRALSRSTPFHSSRPPRHRNPHNRPGSQPLPNTGPEGPSCSRWFSCSHCRPDRSYTGNFFSTTEIRPPPTSEAPLRALQDFQPNAPNEYTVKARRLPLPPTLPYSPDSVPFKRHLELLQLSLSSHPDESWAAYKSLHPSLQRHIPNGLFIMLIRHQLGAKEDAWQRLKESVRYAEECGLRLDEFDSDLLSRIMDVGSRSDIMKMVRTEWDGEEEVLTGIWSSLIRLKGGDIRRIATNVTTSWLLWLEKVSIQSHPDRRTRLTWIALESLKSVAPGNSDPQIARLANDFLHLRVSDEGVLRLSIDALAHMLCHGVKIDKSTVNRVLGRARTVMRKSGTDNDDEWLQLVSRCNQRMSGPDAVRAEQMILEAVQWILHINTSTEEKVKRRHTTITKVIEHPDTSISEAIRLCNRILRGIPDPTLSTRVVVSASGSSDGMNTALSLFERIAHQTSVDCHVLVAKITRKLIQYRDSNDPNLPVWVMRFTNVLISAQLFPYINPTLSYLIFDLTAHIAHTSDEGYTNMRRVYIYTRGAEVPYVWRSTVGSKRQWRKIFRLSLSNRYGHVHFASRLYADRIADGGEVEPGDMLRFIRAIGAQATRSKYVLLDRYLRDYLYFEYSDRQAFVKSMVTGLTACGRPREAWLAFHLSKRILGDEHVPDEVYNLPLDILSRSQRNADNKRTLEILEYVEKGDERSGRFYQVVLRGLAQFGHRYTSKEGRYNIVETTREVYGHMSSRNIRVNAYHVDSVIQIFLKAGDIDRGVRIMLQAANERNSVFPKTAILAIKYLCRRGEFDRAQEVYEKSQEAVKQDERGELEVARAIIILSKGDWGMARIKKEVGPDIFRIAQDIWSESDIPIKKDKEKSNPSNTLVRGQGLPEQVPFQANIASSINPISPTSPVTPTSISSSPTVSYSTSPASFGISSSSKTLRFSLLSTEKVRWAF